MCAGRAGAVPGKKRVPGKFREGSGNRSGNRSGNWLGSRFQKPVPRFQGLDRFQGSRFQEPVPRGWRFHEPVPMGSEVCIDSRVPRFQEPVPMVPRSGNRVPGTKGIKKAPDSGGSVPKVPRVTLYFEIYFCTRDVILLYFESMLLYFESILFYFESILLYFESILVYFERTVLYFESILCVLRKYTFEF